MENQFFDTTFSGGSYAKSGIVTRFRKEVYFRGVRKLKDEASFLRNLPEDIKRFYPQLFGFGGDDNWGFLEEEYLPMKNFRRHIFEESMDIERASFFLKKVLQVSHEEFFEKHKRAAPEDYIEHAYFLRFWSRLSETIDRSPMFEHLAKSPKIFVNDKEYWNAPSLVSFFNGLAIKGNTDLFKFGYVSPYMHGDLHLQNILVGEENDLVKFVDPRGYPVCDLYYDMGKLSHSLNGKYDFIHEGKFSLSFHEDKSTPSYDFNFVASRELETYEQLNPIIKNYCNEIGDPEGLKMLFAEAIHFCSDMPFHLQGNGAEERAVALYITGVMILNKIKEALEMPFDGNKWARSGLSTMQATRKGEWHYEG